MYPYDVCQIGWVWEFWVCVCDGRCAACLSQRIVIGVATIVTDRRSALQVRNIESGGAVAHAVGRADDSKEVGVGRATYRCARAEEPACWD